MTTELDQNTQAPEQATALSAPRLSRGSSRWALVATVVVLAVLVVAAATAAGVATVRHHREAQLQSRSLAAEQAAKTDVVTLLSYTPANLLIDLPKEADLLIGTFKTDYEHLIRTSIAPAAQKNSVTTKARVVASGVVHGGLDAADLLLFVDVSTTNRQSTKASTTGSRIRLHMERVDGRWRIASLDPV